MLATSQWRLRPDVIGKRPVGYRPKSAVSATGGTASASQWPERGVFLPIPKLPAAEGSGWLDDYHRLALKLPKTPSHAPNPSRMRPTIIAISNPSSSTHPSMMPVVMRQLLGGRP